MTLVKWSPRSRQVERVHDAFDAMIQDLLSNTWGNPAELATDWLPSTDIVESDSHYAVKMDLPGMRRDEIKVSVQNGTLTVSGSRSRENTENAKGYTRFERSYGSFTRTFQVPNSIDAKRIEASYKDGVLSLTLPKSEEARPKEIEVRVQ